MIESGQDVGDVEEDPTDGRLLHELEEKGHQHTRCLADEEDEGHDKEGPRQALVVRPPLIRRQVGLRRRGGGDTVPVDEEDEDHVEYEDDDDDGAADDELYGCGQGLGNRVVIVLPTYPPDLFLRLAEDERVNVRNGNDDQQHDGDGLCDAGRTQRPRSVGAGDHDESFGGQAGDQPVGVVADDSVRVIDQTAIGVREVGLRV